MLKWLTLPALFLALPLSAQWPGQNLLGGQVRLEAPGGDLSQAIGTFTPGLGASLQAELHFESNVCARAGFGTDAWYRLGSGSHSVTAYAITGDALCFLQDDGRDFLNGPYVIGGLGAVTWTLGAGASDTGSQQRVTHASASAGFGYRFNRHYDAEVKFQAGKLDPAMTASVAMLCVNYWF